MANFTDLKSDLLRLPFLSTLVNALDGCRNEPLHQDVQSEVSQVSAPAGLPIFGKEQSRDSLCGYEKREAGPLSNPKLVLD